ncbi:MAG: zinc ribbon domain-containing protein [Methanobrevibacter sp.]|nr:zinc ribbon domain-containing protein [Methanobrevibacter sp.]
MVSKCNYCGKEFYNAKGFCPHCGICINDNEYVKFTCPICKNVINYDSDFCGNCGFKITKDINYIIKESNSKSCPNCGNKNNMNAEFCGNCGKDLPLTSDLQLIECPDCKQMVRDDVNYCRFCGHNFLKEKKSLFAKKPKINSRFCQNCGKQISDADKSKFCSNCGTQIPINTKHKLNNFTIHEDYISLLTNKLLVPLSNEYNINFRQTPIRDYFKITKEQESHIFYRIIEKIKLTPNEDIVQYFKSTLDETKNNQENIENEIIKIATESITNSFNGLGLTSTEVFTIKDDYYETVETPVIQNKHGGLTKGVATLGFGLIGYAATSGVKQTVSTKQVLNKGDYLRSLVTISKKYITVKSFTDNSNVNKFNSTKGNLEKTIIYWQSFKRC